MISAEIKDVKMDENGNILVKTNYTDDGRLVLEGGSRYSYRPGETQEQLEARIKADVDQHCKALITRSHLNQRNVGALEALRTAIVGHSVKHNTAEAKDVDAKTVILSKDGSHEAKDY